LRIVRLDDHTRIASSSELRLANFVVAQGELGDSFWMPARRPLNDAFTDHYRLTPTSTALTLP
jgi:hypothetical protein